ncbi:transposase [Rhodococcus sp. ACS1]|uniref:transposase n=1 Tax=Rhodococcus sp. ACS1 TaxID=2028570 RepID=UPI000BB102BE|nr:transposase [Rhodococcus sp. ACS1]PBC48514.1 transposase [Rhodococcus sp. ACS1]PBC49314.1 transposase [Rhodococcus sp. ACS1]
MNRDQQFLLPPDMREWVPPTHPVWTVIEIVDEHLDTSAFHASRRTGGAGRAGYDPDMLVTLLIWAWSRGMRSSRQIERACTEVVSYRVICAGDTPDHVTISRFRKDNHTACQDLFTQVLILAASLGLGRLETIALDGVKIASNASKDANRTEAGLRKAAAAEAARIAAAAAAAHAATDDAEDDLYGEDDPGPGQVPAELADPGTRSARIAEALAQLDADKRAEQAERDGKSRHYLARLDAGQTVMGRVPVGAEVAAAERRLAQAVTAQQAVLDRFEERTASGARGGFVPKPVDEHHLVRRRRTELDTALRKQAARDATAGQRRRNTTDPDSRLQPLRGGGWLQGYNCQAFTSVDGVILATGVGTGPADYDYFPEMVDKAGKAAQLIDTTRRHTNPNPAPAPAPAPAPEELIGVMLFDAGYCSRENLTAPGPDRLIATGKARDLETAAAENPVTGSPPPHADPIAAMTHRLRTEAGIATYRQRSPIAETVFGHAKHNLGFRRFTSRGLDRARSEWAFHAAVHNIGKILTHLTAGHTLPATT